MHCVRTGPTIVCCGVCAMAFFGFAVEFLATTYDSVSQLSNIQTAMRMRTAGVEFCSTVRTLLAECPLRNSSRMRSYGSFSGTPNRLILGGRNTEATQFDFYRALSIRKCLMFSYFILSRVTEILSSCTTLVLLSVGCRSVKICPHPEIAQRDRYTLSIIRAQQMTHNHENQWNIKHTHSGSTHTNAIGFRYNVETGNDGQRRAATTSTTTTMPRATTWHACLFVCVCVCVNGKPWASLRAALACR